MPCYKKNIRYNVLKSISLEWRCSVYRKTYSLLLSSSFFWQSRTWDEQGRRCIL